MGGNRGQNIPKRTLKELLEEQKGQENEREINEYIQSLLSKLNSRNIEQVQQHLRTLIDAIEKDLDGTVSLLFGGSVSKSTYAQGLSDIDVLVQVNNSDLDTSNPEEALSYFISRIKDRLPNTQVERGDLAVTVTFSSGYEIQLLPSVKTKTGYKVPKPGLNEWSNVVRPKKFAEKLTKTNQSNGNKIIPMIKLFKSINDNSPRECQISGYHIESLAIDVFKNNRVYPRTIKDALVTFCQRASEVVLNPLKDNTGQSIHVDEYMGVSRSVERRRVSHHLNDLYGQMNSVNSVDKWKDILKE